MTVDIPTRTRMNSLRIFTLFALACCFACNSDMNGLDMVDGQWICDSQASVAQIPSVSRMDPVDQLLTAQIYADMRISIDAKEREIALNLGNRQGRQKFTLLHDDGTVIRLMTDELLSIERRDDGSILVYDPRDATQKMVFKRGAASGYKALGSPPAGPLARALQSGNTPPGRH